jgi:peptide/nickel transport system permease protein
MANVFVKWKQENESMLKEIGFTIRLLRQSPLAVIGTVIVGLYLFAALFAPIITPYGAEERVWAEAYAAPSGRHLLGADESGGDVFSRIIWGARTSMYIAAIVLVIAIVVGVLLGSLSGFFGGWVDEVIMRFTDVFLSIPAIILAMAFASIFGRSLENMMLALSLIWWPTYARYVRGQALSVKETNFVEAARSLGASNRRLMYNHILPNTIAPIIVQTTLDIGGVVITAAALSFLGFGTPPGAAEWGRMVAEGQRYAFTQPWMFLFPGIALLLFSLGWNLLGDSLRDVLDPRLRR